MTALRLDLIVEQGTTWAHGFKPLLNGVQLISESGWTARAHARSALYSDDFLWEWSTETGNIGIDVSSGAVTLTIDPEESSAWWWRDAIYDLEVVSPDGTQTYRVAEGSIKVDAEVTHLP